MKESVITAVVGGVLAVLASLGIVSAATPDPVSDPAPMYVYGDQR
ncbi:hypothetical protein [Phycicoccus flavus]|nr:hypothetical protein [Phycicoccus flavus]